MIWNLIWLERILSINIYNKYRAFFYLSKGKFYFPLTLILCISFIEHTYLIVNKHTLDSRIGLIEVTRGYFALPITKSNVIFFIAARWETLSRIYDVEIMYYAVYVTIFHFTARQVQYYLILLNFRDSTINKIFFHILMFSCSTVVLQLFWSCRSSSSIVCAR